MNKVIVFAKTNLLKLTYHLRKDKVINVMAEGDEMH